MIKWFAANNLVLNLDKLIRQINNQINSKNHTEEMIPDLSAACYAVRSMVHISNVNTVKSVCCAYFHSIIKYGVIVWGNPANRGKIVTLQQRAEQSQS